MIDTFPNSNLKELSRLLAKNKTLYQSLVSKVNKFVWLVHKEFRWIFLFFSRVIEDFKIQIPFYAFTYDLLKTLNVAPFQLRPNS